METLPASAKDRLLGFAARLRYPKLLLLTLAVFLLDLFVPDVLPFADEILLGLLTLLLAGLKRRRSGSDTGA